MLEISSITPACGAGMLTAEQVLSPAWTHYGQRVLLGAGLIDSRQGAVLRHRDGWRERVVANQATLNMRFDGTCVLGIVHGSYDEACLLLGINPYGDTYAENKVIYDLGFVTSPSISNEFEDPAAAAYIADPATGGLLRPDKALGDAWVMYCEATRSR